MESYFFLDWCPTNTIPIENKIRAKEGLIREHVLDRLAQGSQKAFGASHQDDRDDKIPPLVDDPRVLELFELRPEIMMLDYVARFDGVFLFQFIVSKAYEEGQEGRKSAVAREISDIIKARQGHVHDFHKFPDEEGEEGWLRKTLSFFRRVLKLQGEENHKVMDMAMCIEPVETENPFSDDFRKETKKLFEELKSIGDPGNDDVNLAQLRAVNVPEKRACLHLRTLYSRKKEQCLASCDVKKDNINESLTWVGPLLWSCVFGGGIYFLSSWLFEVSQSISLMLGFMSLFASFVFIDISIRSPVLSLLQRTIGFFHYASIYSRVVESIYKKKGDTSFCNDTGNFQEVIKVLETKHSIESQSLQGRKYFFGLVFALITLGAALAKLSMGFDDIGEHFGHAEGSEVVSQVDEHSDVLLKGIQSKLVSH